MALGAIVIPALISPDASAQTVRVINMIPASVGNETNQDSEPDLTIDPNDPNTIIATAFTPNPSGSLTHAPVYVSTDGGATWALNNIVPSGNGMTGDITVTCSRNGVLYAGILQGGGGLDMRILRVSPCTSATAMTQLVGRTQEDQPYARSITPTTGAQANNDLLFVGHNDFNNSPRTASLEQSLNAATAPPPAGLAAVRLERRAPFGQDGPPIRPAMHPDGTVYAVYTQRTASAGTVRTGNIVVVRDDDFGAGVNPYSDLVDPGDMIAGRRVVTGVTWVFNNASVFGQERLGDRASIAVDPNNSQTVYVAWVDQNGVAGNTSSIHVRRSTDGGQNWSADRLTVNSALSPQLAVNASGEVGILYQELTGAGAGQQWQTHFRQSTDGGATWSDILLASHPANTPAMSFLPYLGDYVGLTTVGDDFHGVFSASNVPDLANFPQGVTYQRAANFTTHTLLDGSGNPVAPSIDSFYFSVQAARPEIQIPGGVDFGDTCAGTAPRTAVLNVCNTGQENLVVDGISSSDPLFAVTTPSGGFPVTISPDFCFPFQVKFTPGSPGPKSATLTVTSNDPDTPSVEVEATAQTGKATAVTLIADTGNFGTVCPNPAKFRDLPLTINNSGSCPLTITAITSSSPEFEIAQVLDFPLSVGPGSSLAVPIRFNPTSDGAKSATITIASNDPDSPSKAVAVTGTAPPPYVCKAPVFAAIDTAIGPTWGKGRTGKYTFNASGRVLVPFGPGKAFGLQTQGEYMFYPGRQEGQFDTGLMYRHGKFQYGVSGSFKAANLRSEASPGSLSHATLGLDVILTDLRFGIFGSKGLQETDVVTLSETIGAPGPSGQPLIATEQLLHTIDQLGGTVQFELIPNAWLDANLAYLHRYTPGASDTLGGAIRVSALVFTNVALTAQLDINESFVGPDTTGTLTFGVTIGRWSRPADYANPVNPLGTLIPRVRYERFERVR